MLLVQSEARKTHRQKPETVFRLQSLRDSALHSPTTRNGPPGKLLRASEKNKLPFKQRAEELAKIQALLTEINGSKAQIERVQSQTAMFFPDKDKMRICNLLKTKLQNLFEELEQLAKLKMRNLTPFLGKF